MRYGLKLSYRTPGDTTHRCAWLSLKVFLGAHVFLTTMEMTAEKTDIAAVMQTLIHLPQTTKVIITTAGIVFQCLPTVNTS